MKSRIFMAVLAAVFFAGSIAPPLLVAPRTAYAVSPAVPTDEFPVSLLTLKEIITSINAVLIQANTYAQYVNTYVLQPLAFIKANGLLKTMVSGVIGFINGRSNGTGAAQFVQNVQGNLQRVGDIQTMAFLVQFAKNSNSPFSSSITSSLRTNYLQNSSMAGFWSANRSTLSLSSPNVNAFLGGVWGQGGTRAWLSLTTQPQNNPYLLYQASQGQLSSVVGGAVAARQQVLNWGQGFLSWCGPAQEVEGPTPGPCPANLPADGSVIACTTPAGVQGVCAASELGTECVPKTGVNPGDSCYQQDGTAGQIKTPSSVIAATLNKTLGANQDKLVQIGSIAKDIGTTFNTLASIWQTVQFAQQVLGGPSSGGLYALGGTSGTGPRLPTSTSTNPTTQVNVANMQQRITDYRTAWATISNAAKAASTALDSLKTACQMELNNGNIPGTDIGVAQIQQAQLDSVTGILTQADMASSTIQSALDAIKQVQAGQLDPSALMSMSPTDDEVSQAQNDAKTTGAAAANPTGSLTVAGGTMVDQMNLLVANAQALAFKCGGTDTTALNGGTLPNLYGSVLSSQIDVYYNPPANKTVCFNFTTNQKDVGTGRFVMWSTTPQYTGGNITYWISETFGGPAMQGYSANRTFSYTGGFNPFTVPEAKTYYFCLKLDKDGNRLYAALWPGSASLQ